MGDIKINNSIYTPYFNGKKIDSIWLNGVELWRGVVPAGQVVFTTSQVWTVPTGVKKVDVFLVGGGSGGAGSSIIGTSESRTSFGGFGGSSGYTLTQLDFPVTPNSQISVVIGAGGAGAANASDNYDITNAKATKGGDTKFGTLTASGGGGYVLGTYYDSSYTNFYGSLMGPGGSGGGWGGEGNHVYGSYSENAINGASDGGKASYYGWYKLAPPGQGTTTRAFGESTGTLYAGGGGGGCGYEQIPNTDGDNEYVNGIRGEGGAGGGGAGAGCLTRRGSMNYSVAGTANTGGGGGGGGRSASSSGSTTSSSYTKYNPGASGGSGIVIVRWKEQ